MIDHCNHTEYASNSKGNAGVTLGAVGTGLGALAALQNGGLGNIFGGGQVSALQQQVMQLTADKAKLESEKYSDGKVQELYNFIAKENKDLTAFLFGIDKRVTAVETAAPLREQILRGEIAQVAQTANCCCQQLTAQIAALNATMCKITEVCVPNTVLRPGVPPVYLTHTAPAAA
jgi:hypothetical protein